MNTNTIMMLACNSSRYSAALYSVSVYCDGYASSAANSRRGFWGSDPCNSRSLRQCHLNISKFQTHGINTAAHCCLQPLLLSNMQYYCSTVLQLGLCSTIWHNAAAGTPCMLLTKTPRTCPNSQLQALRVTILRQSP